PGRYGMKVTPSGPAGVADASSTRTSSRDGSRRSRAHWSRYQAKAPPADRTTPITYHTPGTTWQNVCARSLGSTRGAATGASTVPEVPQLDTASPGVTAPTPAAPQALSAPPPTTGVPGVSRESLAPASLMLPRTCDDPPTSGSSETERSTASSISELQRIRAGSNMRVPDASDGSVASTPVSRSRTKSFASRILERRANASGS